MGEAVKKTKTAAGPQKAAGAGAKSGTAAKTGAKAVTAAKAGASKVNKAPRTKPKRTTDAKSADAGKTASKRADRKSAALKKSADAKSTALKKSAAKSAAGKKRTATRRADRVEPNPVATARHARRAADTGTTAKQARHRKKRSGGGKRPPRKRVTRSDILNACLIIAIATLIALGARQQRSYAEFSRMKAFVDRQTFYEGTRVEGVDVSRMTLSDALAYWRDRVEPRYANRTVTLDDGNTVTSAELGYQSDYESVLNAAWSAGRSGTLEERYRMTASRSDNPVEFRVTRADYSPEALDRYVQSVASAVDRGAEDASIESFDVNTYEFTFKPAAEGRKLDAEALRRDIADAIAAGGGGVRMSIEIVPPRFSTEEVSSQYGLIDYAITNASSSSRARLNNIKLAMSMINGTRVAPGETFSFNDAVGERTTARGFRRATAYSGGDVTEQVGGGICQVSTTLFNAAVKSGMEIVERHNHSLTVSYVDKGKDATVNWGDQDLRFKNTSADDIYICCYLTDDKRVRFGIFGMLLPGGEKITLDAVTTEVTKYDTVYEPTPLLASGQTTVQTKGKNGYKAEAYRVRWDAEGNEISRELLCKSTYKMKTEVVLYGA